MNRAFVDSSRTPAAAAIAAWLPVAVWALFIGAASTDDFGSSRTLFWVDWFIRLGWPDASFETIYLANFVVRKLAHVTEYAIFVLLLIRAFRSGTGPAPRSPVMIAVAVATLLSLGDEAHQALTVARTGSFLDCVTDFGGAVCGALLARGRWQLP